MARCLKRLPAKYCILMAGAMELNKGRIFDISTYITGVTSVKCKLLYVIFLILILVLSGIVR